MDDRGRLRVLVVEDEEGVAEIMALHLEKRCAAAVDIAKGITEARQLLESDSYDVVTVDYQLQDGDGLSFIEEEAAREDTPPMIMVTGHGDESVAVRAFKAGAAGYVVKDKRMSTMLVESVERAIALRRSEKTAELQRDLALEISGMTELSDVVEAALEATLEATGLDAGGVYVIDDDARAARLIHHSGLSEEFVSRVFEMPLEKGNTDLLSPGVPVYGLYEDLVALDDVRRHEGLKAIAIIPILAGGRMIGVMNVASHSIEEIPPESRRVIELLGGQVGEAIQRSELAGATLESETKYRGIFELSPDPLFLIRDGKIVDANPALLERAGLTLEQLSAMDYIEFFKGEDAGAMLEAVERLRNGREVRGLVVEAAAPGGPTYAYEINAIPILGIGDRPAVLAVARDITERQRDERALRAEQEFTRLVFDSLEDAFYVLDAETARVIRWNRAFREVSGYSDEEIPRMTVLDFFDTEDQRRQMDFFERLLAEGAAELEVDAITKEGERIPFHFYSTLVCDEDGTPLYVTGTGRNMSGRKRFEEELRRSDGLYRLITERAGDVIWTIDLDLNLTFASPSIEYYTGYTVEEVLGMRLDQLVTPESMIEGARVLAEELGLEETGREEPSAPTWVDLEIVRKDGTSFWAESLTRFLREEDGTPYGVVGVGRDISGRRAVEEELKKMNAELLGFMHAVSHDLKSPISAIKTSAVLTTNLLGGELDEGAVANIREVNEVIIRSAEKAGNLVDTLLSQAEEGRTPADLEDVDVLGVVRAVMKERAPEIEDRGVEMRIADELGTVHANPTDVYRIFSNLVGNAVIHNTSPDPWVSVSLLNSEDEARWRYLISDNGPGIPEEDMEKVFLPFFKGASGQTGIGLSIVQGIVTTYGGEVRAFNDEGACFEFNLPKAGACADATGGDSD